MLGPKLFGTPYSPIRITTYYTKEMEINIVQCTDRASSVDLVPKSCVALSATEASVLLLLSIM